MVKKLKAMANKSRSENQLAAAVKDSAQEIWLAGLGAFSKAQEEGRKCSRPSSAKAGRSSNAREGHRGQGQRRDGQSYESRRRLQKQANGTWDKLETVFEDRVERALTRLGVPTQQGNQSLTKRVEELTRSVESLTRARPAAAKRAVKAAKPRARKAAAA